jgi:hypothetical protein
VEINSVRYEAEKRGGESMGWPVDEGKQRRREAARLHALRRAARGHDTAVAALLGAGGGRRGTGGLDRAEKAAVSGSWAGLGCWVKRLLGAKMREKRKRAVEWNFEFIQRLGIQMMEI